VFQGKRVIGTSFIVLREDGKGRFKTAFRGNWGAGRSRKGMRTYYGKNFPQGKEETSEGRSCFLLQSSSVLKSIADCLRGGVTKR